MMEACRFDGVFSFVYSPRKGTPAEKMPDRIPAEITKDRMARLLALQTKIQTENNEKYLGKTVRALCEGESKTSPDFLSARNDAGKLIHFPKVENIAEGDYVSLRITEAKAIMLIGEVVL
jgi:tRNA-2-methylthio-N6-dimethylallyladenosine synthase